MDGWQHQYDARRPEPKGLLWRAWACLCSVCLFVKALFTSSGEKVTGRRLLFVTMALMVSAFFGELDRQVLVSAIPKIASEFHSLDQAAWYQTSHDLARLAFLPIFGRVYSLFPLKITYCVCVLVSVTGAQPASRFQVRSREFALTLYSRLRRLRDVVDLPHSDRGPRHPGPGSCWDEPRRIRHNLPRRLEEEDADIPGYHHPDDRRRIGGGTSTWRDLRRELHDLARGLLPQLGWVIRRAYAKIPSSVLIHAEQPWP